VVLGAAYELTAAFLTASGRLSHAVFPHSVSTVFNRILSSECGSNC